MEEIFSARGGSRCAGDGIHLSCWARSPCPRFGGFADVGRISAILSP